MVLERCTNAVASPFGVTGALADFLLLRIGGLHLFINWYGVDD